MLRTYRSELIRFKKTGLIGAGIMVAFTALITMFTFIGFDGGDAPGPGGGQRFASVDLASADGWIAGLAAAAPMIGIVALALFAMSVARDYERGTIRQLLVGEPQRALLLGGKLAALATFIVAGIAGAAVAGAATALVFSSSAAVSTAAWTTGAGLAAVASTGLNVLVATVVWGLAGALLAMLTKSASAAITAGVAYMLIGESLLGLVWDTAAEWLPSGTLTTFTSGGSSAVSYEQSALLLALYAAAFGVATFVVFQRRDITD
ncbi:MAG: ABC transporter permease subunit [bacterium]|nr:ABC transporter permease subunit [bacterium]